MAISPTVVAEIHRLWVDGEHTIAEIAKLLGISYKTVATRIPGTKDAQLARESNRIELDRRLLLAIEAETKRLRGE